MSHELRTPLAAIIGYNELMQDLAAEYDLTPILPYLKKVDMTAHQLLAIISDILDLSKVEAGRMELLPERAHISVIINHVLTNVQPLADKNNNILSVNYPTDIGELYTDVAKLKQILINLLSNAAKFTQNGRITFTITRETKSFNNDNNQTQNDWIIFEIADTGIGIPENALPKLFRPFVQINDSTTRPYGGTGLGLAISQRFAYLLGGNITVQSTLGKGSTFTLIIPAQIPIEESPAKSYEENPAA